MKTIIATSIPAVFAAAGLYHLRNVYNAVHCVPVDKISFSPDIRKSFQTSPSVKITNPHSHVPLRDSRSLTITVPETLSDEEILTRFIKGFFGGHIFRLERGILRAARHELTSFKGKNRQTRSEHTYRKSSTDRCQPSNIFQSRRSIGLSTSFPSVNCHRFTPFSLASGG